jgi:hypothetical protein
LIISGVLIANDGHAKSKLSGKPVTMRAPDSQAHQFKRSRLPGTNPVSLSALAMMHSSICGWYRLVLQGVFEFNTEQVEWRIGKVLGRM